VGTTGLVAFGAHSWSGSAFHENPLACVIGSGSAGTDSVSAIEEGLSCRGVSLEVTLQGSSGAVPVHKNSFELCGADVVVSVDT
jgi:hypothetical protein